MIKEKSQSFNDLETIANWQLNPKEAKVGLPALQRGYVWKPKQVETLWDSLLRGFPIGAFLISDTKESKNDLLDGQQRATAIAMGYYNPWDKDKHPQFFSNKFKNIEQTVPILWLDIGVKDDEIKGENNDFVFLPRLITQSHPWGYNRNGEKLNLDNRRNANKAFDKIFEKIGRSNEKYPRYTLEYVFPFWAAEFPVPLVLLIESIKEAKENWKEKLIDKCKKYLSHIELRNFDGVNCYIDRLKVILTDEKIAQKIKVAIEALNDTVIPIVVLKQKQLENEAENILPDNSTLFIRMNTMGTPLSGEELIYSIFKSTFPASQNIVENAAANFIAPSRIIILISRIVVTNIEIEKHTNDEDFKIPQQQNFKQFRERIRDQNGSFFNKLKSFNEKDGEKIKSLFHNVRHILTGNEEFQLPIPLAVEILKGNADILFILLFWLHKSNLTKKDILGNPVVHKKILAVVTALHWFANDTNKLIARLSKNKSFINGEIKFWNQESFLDSQIIDERWSVHIPNPSDLKTNIINKIDNKWETVFNLKQDKREFFLKFFDRLNFQRSFLIFAQRKYFSKRFQELQWDILLDDANRPYDWDHIYPDSWWVYNIPNLNNTSKEWRWSIGNFRALALEDNRSEGNRLFPFQRLDSVEKRKDSFITDQNWIYWQTIEREIVNEEAITLARAIAERVADIYKDWYTTLNVGAIINFEPL